MKLWPDYSTGSVCFSVACLVIRELASDMLSENLYLHERRQRLCCSSDRDNFGDDSSFKIYSTDRSSLICYPQLKDHYILSNLPRSTELLPEKYWMSLQNKGLLCMCWMESLGAPLGWNDTILFYLRSLHTEVLRATVHTQRSIVPIGRSKSKRISSVQYWTSNSFTGWTTTSNSYSAGRS